MSLESRLLAAVQRIGAEVKSVRTLASGKGVMDSSTVLRVEKVTQAQYNTLVTNGTTVATTLYVIVG